MPRGGGISKHRNNNWNRGGGGPHQTHSQHYSGGSYSDEHDDRDRKPTQRRVSFKPSGFVHRGGFKGRMAELAIKSHLNQEDDVMDEIGGEGGNKYRNNNYRGRRRGSPIPRKLASLAASGIQKISPSTFGWYQISIPHGHKHRREDLIRLLLEAISPDIFIPHYWRQESTVVIFYVDDFKIAQRLQSAHGKIQMPDGFRVNIKVRSGIPVVNIDESFKERVKVTMAKRYNAATKALDLSKFHADPDFKDIFVGLFRAQVLTVVMDIIADHIPELEAINLNGNQIQSMDSFKNAPKRVPNLKIVYLADNRIQSVGALTALRTLPIEELILTNNPLRQRFKDNTIYVSEVRRKFPKIAKLDGQVLAPQIGFDVIENTTLPKAEASYFCNPEGIDIIREFLKQYFIIYDSESRQPLLDAYHEQAMITLCCPNASQSGRLSPYWPFNHNLLRGNDVESKTRLVKVGRLPVVSFLSELPKSQHDLMSFSVDLSVYTPKLISFTVTGLFKETSLCSAATSSSSSQQSGEIRFFQRHFVIIPGVTGGFCIRNEMILITQPTYTQLKTAFKEPEPVVNNNISNSVASVSLQNRIQQHMQPPIPSTSQIPPQIPQINIMNDEGTKLQMVQAMSAMSNMNLEWSKKCLEETNWDFNHAAFVFNKLHKESKIPQEAFLK